MTHGGLLRKALRRRRLGIRTVLQERQSDPIADRWALATLVVGGLPDPVRFLEDFSGLIKEAAKAA